MRQTVTDIYAFPLADLRARGMELFVLAWREIEGDGVLDIDWNQYESLERLGMLRCLGVDRGDELVGYSAFAMLPSMNTRKMIGQSLSLFVRKDCRRSGIGLRLIDATTAAAEDAGAEMHWHAKQGQALDQILPKRGYEIEDVVYRKPRPTAC